MDIFFFFMPGLLPQEDEELCENKITIENEPEYIPTPVDKNIGYVFISYSSKNEDIANTFRKILDKNGIPSWMAPMDIPVGSSYMEMIDRAISGCSCLLLLLTDSAQQSQWIEKEVVSAIDSKKVIIPVQLEDLVLNHRFKFALGNTQFIRIPKVDENSSDIKTILRVISELINASNNKNHYLT